MVKRLRLPKTSENIAGGTWWH